MEKLDKLYRKLNLLSLDIVAGVVICALFFSKIFAVHIRWQGLIALALAVWIIYTTDHLLDAYRIKGTASTERHRFHQLNFLPLAILLGVGIVVNLILIFFMREAVFLWGLLLIAIVLVYLAFQKYLRFFKELIAALLYASGIILPSIAVMSSPIDVYARILIIQFFVTAWFNLVLFSWFDEEKDIRDKHHSFVTVVGQDKTRYFLLLIFSFHVFLFLLQVIKKTPWVFPTCIVMTMNAVLLLILVKKTWFSINDRFRLLGDAIFLLPIFFLL
jgi:4-hydroxybenzoate polyprenyltransferase